MTELPYTKNNVVIIQSFLDETKKRMAEGTAVTFTSKANNEFLTLSLDFELEIFDIERAIFDLTVENYYRGLDSSGNADFTVCAFCTVIGKDNVEVYLKYGLQVNGLEILLFSNHAPSYPMIQPFKKS